MKKIIIVLILLILCGCKESSQEELSVVVPSGAPSLAFYTELNNDNFNTGDAASILPELKGNNGSDIIVIDATNGIKALNAGANYKIAATITFGNFYIASTGVDDNNVMEDGDYIVVFSQGATPDLIFHYIYGSDLDSNLHYVSAVSDASACLIKGINISDEDRDVSEQPYVEYVLIAEPALTAALSQNENASLYENIQDKYYEKSGTSMIQASIFVSNDADENQIKEYLSKLENNINELVNDPSLFENSVSNLSDTEVKDIFGIPNSKIATKALNNNTIGLGYNNAYGNKQAIDNFISIFGMDKTNEEIYFK